MERPGCNDTMQQHHAAPGGLQQKQTFKFILREHTNFFFSLGAFKIPDNGLIIYSLFLSCRGQCRGSGTLLVINLDVGNLSADKLRYVVAVLSKDF